MDASGFGRNAGPPKSGPGSAALAFGAAAATTTPPPVAPPFPAPFPSARPVTSVGAAASRFPSPRPQFAAAAVGTRPGVSAPVPIPLSSGRPAAAAPGASASVRFPSSLTAVDPGAGAATARHVARHLQPQPRVAAPLVSRPVDPIVSSRSRSPPHLPNQYVNSPADYNNGMGQRRLVNYADPLFQNGNAQSSDIGKTTRSPPPHINSKFRPSSSLQNYPPVQIAERNDLARKPNLSPPKLGNQKQSPFHDTHAASSPLLNRNRVVPSSGRPFSAIGIGSSSPPVLVDVAHYDTSTRSMVSQHETSEHVRPQSSLAPFQSRTLDHNISKRSRSPTLSYQDVDGAEARHETGANARRLTDYTDILFEDGNIETSKRMRAPSDFSNMVKFPSSEIKDNIRSSAAGFGSNRAAQNLRSHVDVQKSVASFPEVGSETQSRTSGVRSPPSQMFRLSNAYSNEHNKAAVSPPKPSILGASKRTRTPPLDFSDDDHVMPSTELERENQAKAKRLARFSVELSTPVENVNDFAKAHKGSADKQKQVSPMERLPIGTNDGNDESTLADMDSPGLAVILGLCPDMCPEPERAERERKGDLDRYERLDGDRNQTTELLAVKKYNRTAERDADLIRPLPVLQKTMAYLLSLLDHTYGDDFLGLYNFLWDRMRAIRMDLRMQHFFNREAISMLEQMVRLHIVAMHELCEYNKGEGFSEGFDAHLNIEQMNKTSVELFQMYDDHRRKGVFFSTEKEFRGYYALLKLDKHPGYKVEPAELSLDLAKMSREIRGSSDILFAREVARACRIGNFIAFFRLARKATYLQACLMHAHFAKLRRQALASLHSGLQIGQGIPISHVVGWLAMEDEDIESLAEYHGYVLRQYDEPYLVKEGPFLNSENDFPSGCSQLVHSKKSERVIDDVSYGPVCAHTSEKRETVGLCSGRFASPVSKTELVSPLSALVVPVNARRESGLSPSGLFSPTRGRQVSSPYSGPSSPNTGNKRFSSPYSSSFTPVAGRMESDPVSHSTFSPRASKPASPRASKLAVLHAGLMDEQTISSPKAKGKTTMADESIPEDHDDGLEGLPHEQTELPWSKAYTQDADVLAETSFAHPLADNVASDYSHMHGEGDEFRAHGSDSETDLDEGSPPYREVNLIQLGRPTDSPLPGYEYGDHNINKTKDDLLPIVVSPKKTISSERLKMILRKWRQRAADKRFLREQKNAIAIAALNSLSLGPPVHQTAVVSKHVINELDISHAFKERLARHQRSCSQLNVSELAGPILVERKPDARCLCWKLLVVVPPGDMESQTNNFASKWLLKKLMGFGNEDDGLLFSSASLSIWRKWISHQQTCCLSVVRASDQQVIGNDIANGTGCIIFVVSESISWKIQKARFSSLLASIPAQSNIPLLILSGDTYDEGYDYATQNVIDRLGVSGLREGKIASSLVIFLAGSKTEGYGNGFFDDDKLREGLKWLTSNLPLHPDVVLVKTHDLLLNYLDPSLELLSCRDATDVGPEHCISVFNDAVDQLAEEILAAAYRNPNRWPPLEIDLLERSSNERIFTELFLPNIGWSLPSKIQPLVDIVKSCKLPEFTYDLSELNQGSYLGGQIQDQKLFLEDCLTTYLTQSARLLKDAQAVAETKIMVQKGAVVELRDSDYYLVPKWVTIFRRIYNWRLAKLSTGEFSEAYVLRQRLYQAPADQNVAPQLRLSVDRDTMDKASVLDDYNMIPAVPSGLPLDEIIEISCHLDVVNAPPAKPLAPQLPILVPEEPQAPAHINGGEVPQAPAHISCAVNGSHEDIDDMRDPRILELQELVSLEWDKLEKMFEECTKKQDSNDDGLFIYF